MKNNPDLSAYGWINQPDHFLIEEGKLSLKTEPGTDFWQRTYYGFQNDNAHSFVIPVNEEMFSFTVKTIFQPKVLFDQCGVVLYQDSDNWFKASIEYDNEKFSRLGSVVTNLGYSDWASTDVDPTLTDMFYRLSRRGQDFLIETSIDGQTYKQMRIFHMHRAIETARIGVYACSPLDSSIEATFTGFDLGECQWQAHKTP